MLFRFICEIRGLRERLAKDTEFRLDFNQPIEATIRLGNTAEYDELLRDKANPESLTASVGMVSGVIADEMAAEEIGFAIANPGNSWLNFSTFKKDKSKFTKEETERMWAALDEFLTPLRKLMESSISILRWRVGDSQGRADAFCSWRGYVSNDEEHWLQVGLARSAQLFLHVGFKPTPATPELEREVVRLTNELRDEPLAHKLFREAWNLRESNARSSLVIGVAAAEVGVKRLIGNLVPETQWLMDEIQFPPLSKLLRKYLPSLHVRAKFNKKKILPPSILINTLTKAVECRNKIVHTGQEPPPLKELHEILWAINDLLWICDAYSGQTWVSEHISPEVHEVWENE